jgi:hypothetical protein
MTRLAPERRREESVEAVDVRDTREPPRTQFVKETSTFLSLLRVKDMFAVGERDSRRQDFRWRMRCDPQTIFGRTAGLVFGARSSEVRGAKAIEMKRNKCVRPMKGLVWLYSKLQ